MRIHARHYQTGDIIEVLCENGRITAIQPVPGQAADSVPCYVAPAFFDLQINGCQGISFCSPGLTSEGVRKVVAACHQHGISELFPTLITAAHEDLVHGLGTIRQACNEDPSVAAAIPGIHLEGPFISKDDGPRGAHPLEHVRPPSWDEFCRLQEAAEGRIRLVTLAPEHDGALDLIDRLVSAKVAVALGHTAASEARIRESVSAGACLSTHLGNGAHAVLPRHPNYIWSQLAEDRLWASIISDGFHLPEAVVRCIVRVKSTARTILTCDASSLAGLPPGRYHEWGQDIDILPEGKIVVVASGYLAGSWAFTDTCVANAVRFAGVSLGEACDMAGARPRELLALPEQHLAPGYPANLVLFDWEPGGSLCVRSTILASRWATSTSA